MYVITWSGQVYQWYGTACYNMTWKGVVSNAVHRKYCTIRLRGNCPYGACWSRSRNLAANLSGALFTCLGTFQRLQFLQLDIYIMHVEKYSVIQYDPGTSPTLYGSEFCPGTPSLEATGIWHFLLWEPELKFSGALNCRLVAWMAPYYEAVSRRGLFEGGFTKLCHLECFWNVITFFNEILQTCRGLLQSWLTHLYLFIFW